MNRCKNILILIINTDKFIFKTIKLLKITFFNNYSLADFFINFYDKVGFLYNQISDVQYFFGNSFIISIAKPNISLSILSNLAISTN